MSIPNKIVITQYDSNGSVIDQKEFKKDLSQTVHMGPYGVDQDYEAGNAMSDVVDGKVKRVVIEGVM
jgi:hypothetical protein